MEAAALFENEGLSLLGNRTFLNSLCPGFRYPPPLPSGAIKTSKHPPALLDLRLTASSSALVPLVFPLGPEVHHLCLDLCI